LPVVVALESLDETALVRILKEPKNALTKQYAKLFELEEVKLTFEETALRAVAQKALKRGTGARGLRAILEEILTDVMFELPGRDDVVEVKVTEPSVVNKQPPLLEIAPKRHKKEAYPARAQRADAVGDRTLDGPASGRVYIL
jgi:ATP-dependent Clp protease ATP-binding subunit ClpX